MVGQSPPNPIAEIVPQAMIDDAIKALTQLFSPPLRAVLWKSIGLALALIIVVCITSVTTLGTKAKGTFTTVGSSLPAGS